MNNKLITFNNVYISEYSSLVGKKEHEGPLGGHFDAWEQDEYFGCKSFEQAETEMIRRNLNLLSKKTQIDLNTVGLVLGGDLVNQCVATSFAISGINAPFLGIYGACSTFIEAIICGSAFLSAKCINNAVCVASSHFCTAERQYRFPLEYGSLRTPTSQNTVTGCGAIGITNTKTDININSAIIGRIIDKNITDQNNMGAAMAGAATDTIKRFLQNYDINKIDLIVTGDLGVEGHQITKILLNKEGIFAENKMVDCGMLIYDKTQDIHCGGSGCGCIASVTTAYLFDLLRKKQINNMLLIGTGALLNSNSVLEKRSIPAIAHGIYISTED